MKLFNWFGSKQNKHNVVIPSGPTGPLRGTDLIIAFSTEDEPKVKDFPREKYKVYWEIHIDAVVGGYAALVRFYPFAEGEIEEHRVSAQSVGDLRAQVTKIILETMEQNKR